MRLPLDVKTVTSALRVARDLYRSGSVFEAFSILREVLAAVADSKDLVTVIQKWLLPGWFDPPIHSRFPETTRLSSTVRILNESGRLEDAARIVATIPMLCSGPDALTALQQTRRHRGGTGIAVQEASGLADFLETEGMRLLIDGLPQGLALVGTAHRLSAGRSWDTGKVLSLVRELPKREPPRLKADDMQVLGRAAYDFEYSGRPEQATRIGIAIPFLSHAESEHGVRELWGHVRSASASYARGSAANVEAAIEIGMELQKSGYPTEAANLFLDTLNVPESNADAWGSVWKSVEVNGLRPNPDIHQPALGATGYLIRSMWNKASGASVEGPPGLGGASSEPPPEPPPPPSEPPPPESVASPTEKDREITVTGHALDGTDVFQFKEGETYKVRFRVGPRTVMNLASGNRGITDVPKGGLKTHWVVTSIDVEFVPALSTVKIHKDERTWIAQFDLVIPESGSSKSEEVAILGGATPGNLLVNIYAVFEDHKREIYREVSVSLAGRPEVKTDETSKELQHTHLRPTHEWTTPAEHIQISITNGVATISTKRPRLEYYEFIERFTATDNLISGAIQNVRDSLEKVRERQEAYLNDLDHADISARLASGYWQTYFGNPNGWQPLPDHADAAHRDTFRQVQHTNEWRALAIDGYALFEGCFPKGTKLRVLLDKILPGSRIDFHWTEQSGPGWVSHVPWALMYMEPVDVTGQTPADPEKFLGLRFRIGTRSWSVNKGSVALGDLNTTSRMHLLYWGDKPGDDAALEARWQEGEYKKWRQSRLLPNSALPDLKKQVVLALDAPGPSPVSVLYFYCHCSVGDGAQPCLRFGNSSKPEDTVGRAELSQQSIPDGPVVFANACTTSQADPHMTSELEQRFFQRGVRAFIGTETKVPIKLASKFAWLYFQFFYRIVDPAPMTAGEALTQARMFLWTQFKNVGGLFYSMSNQYDLYLASEDEVLSLRDKERV